jgi:hypothetical protein
MKSKALIYCLLLSLILVCGCTGLEKVQEPYAVYESFSGEADKYDSVSASAPTQGVADSYLEKSARSSSPEDPSDTRLDQKIIKTASLRLEVSDVPTTTHEIEKIAQANEGLIQSSSVTVGQNNQYSGSVTIQVPSSSFEITLEKVSAIGKVISSSVTSDDVSEEYVDLVAQKKALSNQLEQYNRILTKAINVSEILEVQREIERVQVELDRITGRMKYIDSRVSFSTIKISLSEPAQVVTATGHSVASVISEGFTGFVETLVWIIVFILTLLPLIILGGISYFIYQRWKKRRVL